MRTLEHQQHSRETAWVMANLSFMAYSDRGSLDWELTEFLGHEFPEQVFEVTHYELAATDTQAFLASCDQFSVLSIRGTENGNPRDYLTDIRLTQSGGPFQGRHSRVHRGFWAAACSLLRDLDFRADVFRSTIRGQPLFVTGHSLGGALATLVSAELSLSGQPVQAVYTFGSPRVGNRGFAALYDYHISSHWRYVFKDDLVTRLPWLCGYYRHQGQLCWLNKDLELEIEPSLWAYYLKRYKTALRGLIGFGAGALSDHSMLGYLSATCSHLFSESEAA